MHFQRSAAGVCIALLLVGGLISMPTSCDCGAGIAHGHSLFILAGHHHGSDGAVFGHRDDHDGHHHHHESPTLEPQFAGSINHASSRVAVALPQQMIAARSWQRIGYPRMNREFAAGQTVSPEAPPPRAT